MQDFTVDIDYISHLKSYIEQVQIEYSLELDSTRHWLLVGCRGNSLPTQGWKLHLSSTTAQALRILDYVLPVLINARATFKVAASPYILDALNHGKMGPSQVGKFITIYPLNEERAVELAQQLDVVTKDISGPPIPSDRPLRPGSIVHYRYAASGALIIQNKIGEIVPAMLDPTGMPVPDIRHPVYTPPAWAKDPFIEAGLSRKLPSKKPIVADRFLVVSVLYQSARGNVLGAVDLVEPRTCVVKQATQRPLLGVPGREVSDLLRSEYQTLRAFDGISGYPRAYMLLEDEENVYCAMEWLQSETLEHRITTHKVFGAILDPVTFVNWCDQITSLLTPLHGRKFVYSDLKTPNLLINQEDQFSLVDFELVRPIGSPGLRGMGTRGYVSPQQDAGQPACIQDDIWGLGAVLFFLATGAEPSKAPDRFNLLSRPLELLNPWYGAQLKPVLQRCFGKGDPYRSVKEVATDVRKSLDGVQRNQKATYSSLRHPEITSLFQDAALAVVDYLCVAAEYMDDTVHWTSRHPLAHGAASRDVNTGTAGVAIALAYFRSENEDLRINKILEGSAEWLANQPPPLGDPVSGFYVGDSGVATALLVIGNELRRDDLVDKALQLERLISQRPYESPDIFNGTAGRLCTHLLFHACTGNTDALDSAVEAGDVLRQSMKRDPIVGWQIPPDHGDLSNKLFLGYAHGTAGIADALLELYLVTHNPALLELVVEAAESLVHQGIPSGFEGQALNWPSAFGEKAPAAAYWCHGAAGIGLFLIRAATKGGLTGLLEPAQRALRMVAESSQWMQPTRCHGLAGNIEVLIDAWQLTGDDNYLEVAHELGAIMLTFGRAEAGGLTFPGDDPSIMTPDFMVGASGVLAALVRLANPARPKMWGFLK